MPLYARLLCTGLLLVGAAVPFAAASVGRPRRTRLVLELVAEWVTCFGFGLALGGALWGIWS